MTSPITSWRRALVSVSGPLSAYAFYLASLYILKQYGSSSAWDSAVLRTWLWGGIGYNFLQLFSRGNYSDGCHIQRSLNIDKNLYNLAALVSIAGTIGFTYKKLG
jgi:hypothetical protein